MAWKNPLTEESRITIDGCIDKGKYERAYANMTRAAMKVLNSALHCDNHDLATNVAHYLVKMSKAQVKKSMRPMVVERTPEAQEIDSGAFKHFRAKHPTLSSD